MNRLRGFVGEYPLTSTWWSLIAAVAVYAQIREMIR